MPRPCPLQQTSDHPNTASDEADHVIDERPKGIILEMFHLDVHIQRDTQIRASKPLAELDIIVSVLGEKLDIESPKFFEGFPTNTGDRAEEPIDSRRAFDIRVANPEVL